MDEIRAQLLNNLSKSQQATCVQRQERLSDIQFQEADHEDEEMEDGTPMTWMLTLAGVLTKNQFFRNLIRRTVNICD